MREDVLSALLWAPGFLLGLLLIGLAIAVLVLVRRLRGARDAATYAELDPDDPLGEYDLGGSGSDEEMRVADLRGTARKGDLGRLFRRVEALTEKPGPGTSGRLPWFLCLGPTGSGKSTMLGHSDLRLPFGEPPPPPPGDPEAPCRLWVFDSAVVVDVEGDLVLPASGVSVDRAAWLALLKAQRSRERGRPGDGIVLVLPADQLAAARDDPTAQRLLGRRADRLRRCMEQAQRAFGLRLPVWVVLSRFDRLPGVADLLTHLDPVQKRQIFGWSNPHPASTPYAGAWADDVVDTVAGTLQEHQLRVLAARPAEGGDDFADLPAFLALPGTVATLTRPLRTVLSRLFAGGPSMTAPPLRGVYLTAGEGFDAPPPASSHDFAAAAVAGTVAPLAAGGHRDVAFVTDLLSEKVFAEWDLAQPDPEVSHRRSRIAGFARAAALVLLAVGLALLLWSGWRTAVGARLLTDGFVQPAQRALECGASPDCLQPAAIRVLDGADQVPDYRLRTLPLPASWMSPLTQLVPALGKRTYEGNVFPALHSTLDRRRNLLLKEPRSLGDVGYDPLAVRCPLLGQDGEARPASGSAASSTAPIYDLASTPAYDDLRTWLADLTDLQTHLAIYNRFEGAGTCLVDETTTLSLFAELTRYTFAHPISPPTREARDFYGQILCDVRPAALVDLRQVRSTVDDRLDARFSGMLRQLFQENAVTGDLVDLRACIDELAERPLPEEQAARFYADLVSLIDRTRTDLSRPKVQWIASPDLSLGSPYQQLMRSIATPAFTSQDAVQRVAGLGNAGYLEYQAQLQKLATGPTGPLLQLDGGKLVLQLTPKVLGLRAALTTLVDTYLGGSDESGWREQPPPRTWLAWDRGPLAEAASHLAGYLELVDGELGQYPGLRPMVSASTRDEVERNVLEMAALGQSFPPDPKLVGTDAREAQLSDQVDLLQGAAEPLNQLLTSFRHPSGRSGCDAEPDIPFCRVGRTVAGQQERLLDDLDELYGDLGLYRPSAAGLAAWDGSGNLAWQAFRVSDEAGLAGYVAAQRSAVGRLSGSIAQPLLTAVPIPGAVGAADPASETRWSAIAADLQSYKDGTPGNPLAEVESFITSAMATTTPANCLEVSPADVSCTATGSAPSTGTAGAAGGPVCDPFRIARNRLVLSTSARCQGVVLDQGTAAWEQVADAFGRQLRGRYPFAPAASHHGDRDASAATPDQVAGFFTTYGVARPALQRLEQVYRQRGDHPQGPSVSATFVGAASEIPTWPSLPWAPEGEAAAASFLDDMDGVQEFFGPFLTARAEAVKKDPKGPLPLPAFGLAADLRPRPGLESGGDAVIRRILLLDGSAVSRTGPGPAAAGPPATWTYNAPLSLSLEWAKDGPYRPDPPAGDGVRVDGPTVTWSYPAPWSLIHLLQEPTRDGLLQIQVPTERAQRPEDPCRDAWPCGPGGQPPQVPAATPVVLLLEVAARSPDEAARTLPLPDFPTTVPEPEAAAAAGKTGSGSGAADPGLSGGRAGRRPAGGH